MNSISSDLFHLYVIGVRERSREKCQKFQAVWLHVISAAFKPTHAWCHLGKSASGQLKQSRNIQRLKSPISSCSTFPSLELLGKNQDALKWIQYAAGVAKPSFPFVQGLRVKDKGCSITSAVFSVKKRIQNVSKSVFSWFVVRLQHDQTLPGLTLQDTLFAGLVS